ncbi:MAG TPA: helix-turn-helix domain-containing protein, partial [Candidatus Deferrimicrobiaceae bacterium]
CDARSMTMVDIGKKEESLSIDEAARGLGTTPTKILTMIRSKELAGIESERGWRVSRESLSRARVHGIDHKPVAGCATGCKSRCGCG